MHPNLPPHASQPATPWHLQVETLPPNPELQVETNASRVREQQTRISQLEIQMRNQAQLEEEIKMYKEQARCLAEPPPQPQP